ncbi:fatty acyl-CoA hydrolase precursor, medium chain-like [Branchiostoma floridae x Branchiostoma belcheri]
MGRCAGRSSGVRELVVWAGLATLLRFADGVAVSTTYGDVNGVEFTPSYIGGAVFDRIYTFKGIPYAAPPVGDLRWRPPQNPASWTGVRDASQFGSRCPQVYDMPPLGTLVDEITRWRSNSSSEDCLFLNVFTPNVSDTAGLPVMLWLHGGGMAIGSADTYPAEIPTFFNNVVMVTINYRLSGLGFMPTRDADTDGNYAVLDVVKALQWVQSNIRNFGGDPDRVTVFGQSGGAWLVSLLVMSPVSAGMFHRAVSQSGVAGVKSSRRGDLTLPETLAAALNCTTASYDDMMTCLRGKPPHPMLDFDIPVPIVGGRELPDGDDLWDLLQKKQVNEVDYLLGTTSGENSNLLLATAPQVTEAGLSSADLRVILPTEIKIVASQYAGGDVTLLVQPVIDEYIDPAMADDPIHTRDQFIQLMTDGRFAAPTVMMAQAESAHPSARVYQYEFQHRSDSVLPDLPSYAKADHGDDLFYLFGLPFLRDGGAWKYNFTQEERELSLDMMAYWTNFAANGSWKYNFTQEERELSLDMMAYWANFAANGDPSDSTGSASARDLVTWPRYTAPGQHYLQLDVTSSASTRLRQDRMSFWNRDVPVLMGKKVPWTGGTGRSTWSVLLVAFSAAVCLLHQG